MHNNEIQILIQVLFTLCFNCLIILSVYSRTY